MPVPTTKFSRPGALPLDPGPSGRLGRPARAAPLRSSPRALASSRPRTHPKGYKGTSVKGYGTCLSRRKPRPTWRLPGGQALRSADRPELASLYQLPPRTTRYEPDEGPAGSTAASAVYGPYQSCTHSQTLPCMSYSPQALGLSFPTGWV